MEFRRSYTLEDWMNFVECYSEYVFRPDCVPACLYKAWDLIVQLADHYIRPGTIQVPKGTSESARRGAMLSKELAVLMETVGFPDNCFSYNLHLDCCR
eukprot:scaffold26334_cov20-Tisochrysis_lutea.AAC.1